LSPERQKRIGSHQPPALAGLPWVLSEKMVHSKKRTGEAWFRDNSDRPVASNAKPFFRSKVKVGGRKERKQKRLRGNSRQSFGMIKHF